MSETRGSVIHADLERLRPQLLSAHARELQVSLQTLGEDQIVSEEVFSNKYEKKQKIGEGATSQVWFGENKETKEEVAIKIVKSETLKNNAGLIREIRILRSLDHPNIIKLRDVIRTEAFLYIVMELAGGPELFDTIVEKKNYSEEDARQIVQKLLGAIAHMHERGIAHRDLKPENILYSSYEKDADIKLVDFGFAKSVITDGGLSTPLGTLGYKAPELIRKEAHDMAVDMWSLGIITYILLCGFPPFFSCQEHKDNTDFLFNAPFWYFFNDETPELLESVVSGNHDFPEAFWANISTEAKEFVSSLLKVDPKERMKAKDGLNHPWIKGEKKIRVRLDTVVPRLGFMKHAQHRSLYSKDSKEFMQIAAERIHASMSDKHCRRPSLGQSLIIPRGKRHTDIAEPDQVAPQIRISTDEVKSDGEEKNPKTMSLVRALYTYNTTNPRELKFEEGEEFAQIFVEPDLGWAKGQKLDGSAGWYPSSYVETVEPLSEEKFAEMFAHTLEASEEPRIRPRKGRFQKGSSIRSSPHSLYGSLRGSLRGSRSLLGVSSGIPAVFATIEVTEDDMLHLTEELEEGVILDKVDRVDIKEKNNTNKADEEQKAGTLSHAVSVFEDLLTNLNEKDLMAFARHVRTSFRDRGLGIQIAAHNKGSRTVTGSASLRTSSSGSAIGIGKHYSYIESFVDLPPPRAPTQPPTFYEAIEHEMEQTNAMGLSRCDLSIEADEAAVRTVEENGKTKVLSGSLAALTKLLADERSPNTDYIHDFLQTHQYFTTSMTLMKRLRQRYEFKPLIETADLVEKYNKWRGPIRLRVINVVKKWIENFYDTCFAEDASLKSEFFDFVDTQISVDNEKWANMLKELFREKSAAYRESKAPIHTMSLLSIVNAMANKCKGVNISGKVSTEKLHKKWFLGSDAIEWLMDASYGKVTKEEALSLAQRLLDAQLIECVGGQPVNNFRTDNTYFFAFDTDISTVEPPPPLLPKSTENLFILDIPALEFARQITLYEHSVYQRITPAELVKQAWRTPQSAPNASLLTSRLKQVKCWAMTEIVLTPNTKNRAAVITRLIQIADLCRKFSNFNTLLELLSALSSSQISALNQTWKQVPSRVKKTLTDLQEFMSKNDNYRTYRATLNLLYSDRSTQPYFPAFEILQRDLVSKEEELSKTHPSDEIKFEVYASISNSLSLIKESQKNDYQFYKVKAIRDFILNSFILSEDEIMTQVQKIEHLKL